MADGSIKIGTILDETGLRKGLNNLGNFAKSGFSTIAKTGAVALGAVTAALGAAGAASIAVGKEFETSFAKASTLFGDVNVDTDNLKNKILEVSNATGVAATELNESLYSALSAGIPLTEDASEVTAFLESSAKLAKAGFTDLDTALSATAKTLNAYGMDVSEADRINKILIQTQNKGITTVGELGASLAQVTPTAAAFGVSFENVGAALSNMTAAGTPTAQATTQLNSLIAELGKNGTIGAKSLEKATKGTQYAGKGFKELMDSGVPLNEVLDLIRKSADDSGLSMVDMFSSIEAGKAALALSGENSEKFATNLEAMSVSADVVTEAYDKVSNTFDAKMVKMKESAKNLGIQIYQGMQEPLKGLADMGLGYMDELSKAFTEGGVEGLVSAGANIVSDIALGITQQLPSLIEMAVSFIETIVLSLNENMPQLIEAGGALLGALIQGVLTLVPSLLSLGWSIVSGIVQGLSQRAPQMQAQATNLFQQFLTAIRTQLPQLLQQGADAISQFAQGLLSSLPGLISNAGNIVNQLLDAFLDILPQIMETGVQLIGQLATGIITNLPEVIGAIYETLIQLVATIASHLPEILQKGYELIGELAAGIIQAIPVAVGKIPEVIASIKDKFMEFDWLQIGKDIVSGIANGLKNSVGTIIDAAKSVGEAALNGLKSLLGIHSPSRVMRDEVGKNIALGIAEGITQNSDYATKSVEEIADAILQTAKTKLDNTKVYNDLTLSDEVAYWNSVRKQVKDGTQAKIDADKQYFQTKKSLNQKTASLEKDYASKVKKVYEDLEKNIQSLRDSYADELTTRTKDIAGSMGLFEEFSVKTELTTTDLLNNLKSQVSGLKDWSNNLKNLEKRGVTGDMLDELRGMGTDAAGEIALMTQLTDAELSEYVSLWKQKQRLARKEAEKELAPALSEMENQISQMRAAASVELETYKQEFVSAMTEIGVQIQKPLDQIQSSLLQTMSSAVQLAAGAVSSESDKQANVNQFAALADNVIQASASLPKDFTSLGSDTVAGMIQGLQGRSGELYSTMISIMQNVVRVAKEELQIHSPSHLMRDAIGRNMIAGIGVGFELESDNLNNEAQDVIRGTVDTMRKTSAQEFVRAMQSQSLNTTAGTDARRSARNDASSGNELRPTLVLEKGSIEVKTVLEGREVAKTTAPYMDTELGTAADTKMRGGEKF